MWARRRRLRFPSEVWVPFCDEVWVHAVEVKGIRTVEARVGDVRSVSAAILTVVGEYPGGMFIHEGESLVESRAPDRGPV